MSPAGVRVFLRFISVQRSAFSVQRSAFSVQRSANSIVLLFFLANNFLAVLQQAFQIYNGSVSAGDIGCHNQGMVSGHSKAATV